MTVVRLDRITDALKARGIPAYTEQTGGGVATIFAGPRWDEPDFGWRYGVVAGPGWFQDSGFTNPHADTEDFGVGPDNEDAEYVIVPVDATYDDIIELIVAEIAKVTAANPLVAAGDTTWAGDLTAFRADLIRSSHTS